MACPVPGRSEHPVAAHFNRTQLRNLKAGFTKVDAALYFFIA
jgi:hypothetical protein